jgi:hypothetical protein
MVSLSDRIAAPDRAAVIEEAARRTLSESPYPVLRRVVCRFDHGVLTMRGRLSSFFLKQMAQTAVSRLEGIERIDNFIEVSS